MPPKKKTYMKDVEANMVKKPKIPINILKRLNE
jgi:hypothetical protein